MAKASGGEWVANAAQYFDFGRIGVVAFFCISGFVIPNSLRGNRLDAFKSFTINRLFRLYPIYWVSIILGIIFVWKMLGQTPSGEIVFHNVTMGAGFLGSPYIMGLYWTLEVELFFYCLCVLLYLFAGRINYWIVLFAFAVCSYISNEDIFRGREGYLPHLAYFLSLMFLTSAWRILYDLHSAGKFEPTKPKHLGYLLVTIFITQVALNPPIQAIIRSFSNDDPVLHRYGYGQLFGIALFFGFAFLPKTSKALAHIGRATYSAYLIHPIVLTLLTKSIEVTGFPTLRLEIYVIVTAAITIPISLISYRYIEQPCIAFGKRLAKRSRSQATESAAKTDA